MSNNLRVAALDAVAVVSQAQWQLSVAAAYDDKKMALDAAANLQEAARVISAAVENDASLRTMEPMLKGLE